MKWEKGKDEGEEAGWEKGEGGLTLAGSSLAPCGPASDTISATVAQADHRRRHYRHPHDHIGFIIILSVVSVNIIVFTLSYCGSWRSSSSSLSPQYSRYHLHQAQDHMVFIIITIIAQVTIILIICHQHHPRPFRHYSFSITIIIVYSLNNAQFSENIFGCFCLYLVCWSG